MASLRQRFYTLIGFALIWFVFGTMVLIRSNKDLSSLSVYEGQIDEIGTTITKIPIVGKPKNILYFTIKGLNKKLGIYHNTKVDYDFYFNKIGPGDSVKVYFDEFGSETMENSNLHVFQLEKGGQILLDRSKLKRRDRKVGLILYVVGLLFSIAPIWFYQKRMRT